MVALRDCIDDDTVGLRVVNECLGVCRHVSLRSKGPEAATQLTCGDHNRVNREWVFRRLEMISRGRQLGGYFGDISITSP